MPDNEKTADEKWKQQEKAEKERLARKVENAAPDTDRPEATLLFLASGLVSQALIGLGQIPNPITNKQEVNLEEAKFAIDTLQVLQDKTTGNLTDEERRYLDTVLYDLRVRFLDVAR